MPGLDHIPLLKIFFFFAGGIVFAEFIHEVYDFSLYFLVFCLLILPAIIFYLLRSGKTVYFSISVALFLFLAGIFLHRNYDERNGSNHYTEFISPHYEYLKVEVISKVKTASGFRIKSRVTNCLIEEKSHKASGNLLIFTDSLSELT